MGDQSTLKNNVSVKREKIRTREERKVLIKWGLVLFLVAFLFIMALNYLITLCSKIDITDHSYAPRDIERQYHEVIRKLRGE